MIIAKLDPISKLLPSSVDTIQTYSTLAAWKFAILRQNNEVIFVKSTESRYILAIDKIDKDSMIIGIWSIEDSEGISTDTVIFGLKTLLLISVPPVQLNIYNTAIFDTVISPAKLIESNAFEILCRLIVSKEHSNKSNKELAIKSLQLASEFHQNYSHLISTLATS